MNEPDASVEEVQDGFPLDYGIEDLVESGCGP